MSVAQLDVTIDRQMPQSPDAERAVLGSILINNNAFYRVIGVIDTDDFFKDGNRTIFATMRLLAEQSRPIDILTVKEELAKHAQLDTVGGYAYITSLVDVVPDIANVERYAAIIKEKSTLRRLIVMGNSVMRAALDTPGEPGEVLAGAEKTLYEIAEGSTDKGFVGLDKITRVNMAAIEQIASAGKLLTGVPTGYERFDEMTSGFQPQDLIILAARPSMGKAQPLDAKVLTRRGWTCMGSLEVGDELASVDGAESRVVGVFPQGERQVYRVEFSDGRSAECCLEHLWRVHYRSWSEPRIVSTEWLIAALERSTYRGELTIETFAGEFSSEDELPVDPLLLGSSLRQISVIAVDSCEAEAASGGRYGFGLPSRHIRKTTRAVLATAGIWTDHAHETFIPERYLSASCRSRAELLKGLLDIDQWDESSGSARFVSHSERLTHDVVDVVRSIGGTACLSNASVGSRTAYECNIEFPGRTRRLTIRSITPTRLTQTQCIAVSHPSHLYITNDFTVTHNTSFMMNIAEAIALPGKDGMPRTGASRLQSVGVFSLEMSKEQIGLRILSSESGVSSHLIRSGMLSERNWRDLADAAARLAKGKIFVDDTPGMDPLEMRAKARRLKMEMGLDMIMVDYLQLMAVKGRIESRQAEISQISRGLKAIAKELNVPMLALSQLSRRPEQRTGDHRPQLSDLRESGAIEQDADLVCFIYRDEVYNKETEEKGIAEIIIAKQRNGPIGDFKLVFRNDITKFFNYEPQPDYVPN